MLLLQSGRRGSVLAFLAAMLVAACVSAPARAQTIAASVNVGGTIVTMPEYGIGVHTSVYDNSLWHIDSPGSSSDNHFDLLPGMLDDAGVETLRYPGGGYADVFHFSVTRQSGRVGGGL
jgi:hypothetical protein